MGANREDSSFRMFPEFSINRHDSLTSQEYKKQVKEEKRALRKSESFSKKLKSQGGGGEGATSLDK